MVPFEQQVPVTLLTGFLGAGKTTVLNHLIRGPDVGRIAVIMNEFGDAGLDHDLIEEATEETVLMQSGCLCCTIRGDLIRTLGRLIARRKRGELRFDRVVIETTGIADPGPILHSLIADNIVGPYYRMDGVVTVVDAAHGSATLNAQFEALQQVATADLIVLSKTDRASVVEIARLEARLTTLNPAVKRLRAEHGRVPQGALFNLSALRKTSGGKDVDAWLGAAVDPLAGLSGFAPTNNPMALHEPTTDHDHRIVSVSFEEDGPISAEVFDLWLDTLIALKGGDILRMKGIVHLEGMQFPFVFHGVQHIFDAPVPLTSWGGQDTRCRVVVIARDMTEAELRGSLDILRAQPKPRSSPEIAASEMPF